MWRTSWYIIDVPRIIEVIDVVQINEFCVIAFLDITVLLKEESHLSWCFFCEVNIVLTILMCAIT